MPNENWVEVDANGNPINKQPQTQSRGGGFDIFGAISKTANKAETPIDNSKWVEVDENGNPISQTPQPNQTFLGVPKEQLQQYYNQQVQKQQAQQPLQVQPQIGVNPTAQQPVKAISTKLYPTLQTPPEEPAPYKTIEQEQFESQQFQQKILNPNQFIIDETGQMEQPKQYVVAKPKKVLGLPTEEQANKFVEQRNLPKIKEVAKYYQDTDPQKSSFMWEQAINIEPNNYENYLNYSYNQAQLGNAQQALDNANTAEAILKSTPLTRDQKYRRVISTESYSVYQIQSWAKNKLGDYEGSIAAGKKSLQILSQKPTGEYAHQQNEKDYENASYTYGVMANSAAKMADENGANKYNEQSKKMLNVANGIRVAKENEAYRQWFASGQFEKDFLYSFVQPEIDAIMGVGEGVKSMVETSVKVMQSKGDLKGNVLKTVNTAISTVFSGFMAANPVVNYGFAAIGTMGEGYAPEIYQSLMTPVSAFIKDKSDLSETQKELVNTADVIGMLLVFKLGHNVIKGVGEGNSIKAEKQAIQDAELTKKVVGMQKLTEAELKKVEQIIEDAPDTEVNKAAQMALKVAEKKKEIQTETDTKIAVAQKKGFYEKDVKTQISDEVFTTIDKLEKGEPVTNDFIDKASTELYNEYKRLEKIKEADTRTNTIEQINNVQEQIGKDIEMLESVKQQQRETGKFISEQEQLKPEETQPVEKAVEPVSEPINEPVNEVKPFDQRTDTEHATYIKDQFRKQFSEKGVPQEQIDGAIALMEARAKASGKGDGWYRGIEDVKSGEFQGENLLYQYIGENAKLGKEILDNLDVAKKMETSKESPEKIKQATGWHRGIDEKWKYETDDSTAKIKIDPLQERDSLIKGEKTKEYKLSEILDDKKLLESVPELKDTTVILTVEGDLEHGSGKINGENYIQINLNKNDAFEHSGFQKILRHELQHTAQSIFRFAKGDNADTIRERMVNEFREKNKRNPSGKEHVEIFNKADREYRLSAGELEARDVENRIQLTKEERKQNMPFKGQDISEAIIKLQRSGDVARGAVETLENGKKVIHALERPDFSTMVHEIAHIFEGDLTKAELKTVKDIGGSEKFARGFERYLRDGKAPTAELKTLFEKFKTWLTDIYKTLKGSEIENKVSPEVKKIFDRLLTEQEKAKPTEVKPEPKGGEAKEQTYSFKGKKYIKGEEHSGLTKDEAINRILQDEGGNTWNTFKDSDIQSLIDKNTSSMWRFDRYSESGREQFEKVEKENIFLQGLIDNGFKTLKDYAETKLQKERTDNTITNSGTKATLPSVEKGIGEKTTGKSELVSEPPSKSVLKQYTDNQEQLYKDHVEKTLQDKGIEIGNDKELVTQEVLNEMSKNPDKPISENVEKGVDNYLVESTAKALEGIDESQLPEVIDKESYLAKNGAPFMGGAEPALHKNIQEGRAKQQMIKRVSDEMNKNNQKREELRKEYEQKVKEGKILPPNRNDKLIASANSNPDLESTQAARRLLEKKGIDWQIGKTKPQSISEAYHKAKADGSNPGLVKAVESLLSKEQTPTPKGNTSNVGGDVGISKPKVGKYDGVTDFEVRTPEQLNVDDVLKRDKPIKLYPEQIVPIDNQYSEKESNWVADRDIVINEGYGSIEIKKGDKLFIRVDNPANGDATSSTSYKVYIKGRSYPLSHFIPETAEHGSLDEPNHFDAITQMKNFDKVISGEIETPQQSKEQRIKIAETLIPNEEFYVAKPYNARSGFESPQKVILKDGKWLRLRNDEWDNTKDYEYNVWGEYADKNELAWDIVSNARVILKDKKSTNLQEQWNKQFDYLTSENKKRVAGKAVEQSLKETTKAETPTVEAPKKPTRKEKLQQKQEKINKLDEEISDLWGMLGNVKKAVGEGKNKYKTDLDVIMALAKKYVERFGLTLEQAIDRIRKEAPDEYKKVIDENKGEILSKKEIGLTHEETAKMREELGLPEMEKQVKHDTELLQQAEEKIKGGINIDKLANDITKGKKIGTDVDYTILSKAAAEIDSRLSNPQISEKEFNELFNRQKKLIEAAEKTGSESGRSLGVRSRIKAVQEDSISDFLMSATERNKGAELTEEQIKQERKEFEELKKSKEDLEKELERLKADAVKKAAKQELDNLKSEAKKQRRSVKKEKLDDEFEDLSKEFSKIVMGQLHAGINPELVGIVAKMAKNRVEKGIVNLADVVDNIHDSIKGYFTKEQIEEIIAGEHNEKKATRNELQKQKYELQQEARAVTKLRRLQEGEQPKTEQKKRQQNQRIFELQKQIKEHDLTKLAQYEARMQRQIDKLQDKLDKGEFMKEPPKVKVKLTPQARELTNKYIRLKQERDIRIMREEYNNRKAVEKARDIVIRALNTPRTIMASMDYSAPLRQGVIAMAAHPIIGGKAFGKMFKFSVSEKEFDRWFYELKGDPLYPIAKESKLYIADPMDLTLNAKEEMFGGSYAEQIPGLKIPIKASERAYVGFLNKVRWDLFKNMVDRFESQGKTYDNSPELYKAAADYINTMTGRGRLGKLENSAAILNSVLFAPRLIASRIKMLTNFMNPSFYMKTPKEVRVEYFKDMGKFIGLGMTVIALAKLGGAEVEDDPRSTDFGKIKVGNSRWDIWGGFGQYIRVITQLLTGQSKSTQTGIIRELNGEDVFGQTRGDVAIRFARGKLAPVPSMVADFMTGRKVTGEEISAKNEVLDRIVPLIYSDIKDAYKDKGVSALFSIGVPAMFGVGVQTFDNRDYVQKIMDKRKNPKPPITDEEKLQHKMERATNEQHIKEQAEKYGIEYVPPKKAKGGTPNKPHKNLNKNITKKLR